MRILSSNCYSVVPYCKKLAAWKTCYTHTRIDCSAAGNVKTIRSSMSLSLTKYRKNSSNNWVLHCAQPLPPRRQLPRIFSRLPETRGEILVTNCLSSCFNFIRVFFMPSLFSEDGTHSAETCRRAYKDIVVYFIHSKRICLRHIHYQYIARHSPCNGLNLWCLIQQIVQSVITHVGGTQKWQMFVYHCWCSFLN